VLSQHFQSNNPQVSKTKVEIIEYCWQRMIVDGTTHAHSFINGGSEKHTTTIVQTDKTIDVASGIKDLLILKTTDSAFKDYIRDQYTTLKETNDRILSTFCEIEWDYVSTDVDFTLMYNDIRGCLLKTFSAHKSLSVQHTLYAMGEDVLHSFSSVKEITLKMPNKHHIPANLEPFGMENKNEIFIATDEPYGYITGTVTRD
jgi:urate oxidase